MLMLHVGRSFETYLWLHAFTSQYTPGGLCSSKSHTADPSRTLSTLPIPSIISLSNPARLARFRKRSAKLFPLRKDGFEFPFGTAVIPLHSVLALQCAIGSIMGKFMLFVPGYPPQIAFFCLFIKADLSARSQFRVIPARSRFLSVSSVAIRVLTALPVPGRLLGRLIHWLSSKAAIN